MIQEAELQHVMRACMDENGMSFDEESVEELTRALYQVNLCPLIRVVDARALCDILITRSRSYFGGSLNSRKDFFNLAWGLVQSRITYLIFVPFHLRVYKEEMNK